jgi:hypothetical protein
MKFFQKLGSLAACAALTGATLLFNVPKYSIQVQAAETVSYKTGKIVKVSCGDYHTMALDEFGNLWAWGKNTDGQLGDGTNTDRSEPVQILPGHKFVDISAGANFSVALDSDGYYYTCGSTGETETAGNVLVRSSSSYPDKYSDVNAMYYGTRAISTDASTNTYDSVTKESLFGRVYISYAYTYSYPSGGRYCSFLDTRGYPYFSLKSQNQLASGTSVTQARAISKTLKKADSMLCIYASGASGDHTYSFNDRDFLIGIDQNNQLVRSEFAVSPAPTLLTSTNTPALSYAGSSSVDTSSIASETFQDVAFASNNCGTAYAVATSGTIYSWGYNSYPYNLFGSSSSVSQESSFVPVAASSSEKFISVSAGHDHAIAITSDGEICSWGSNAFGQLGISGVTSEATPTTIPLFTKTNQYSFVSLIGETFSGTFAQSGASSYSVVTNPSKGILSVDSASGEFTYLPNDSSSGQDFAQISYTLSGIASTFNVNISIDRKPVITGTSSSFNVQQDSSYSGIVNAVDLDGDSLTYSISTNPAKASVSIDSSLGKYTYVPNKGAAGNDSFIVTVSDGLASASITISVHIESQIAVSDTTSFVVDNTSNTSYSGNMGATDADGDILTYSVSTNPTKGTVSVSSDGTYVYTPTSGQYGSDSFSLMVTDGVNPVNVQYSVSLYIIKDNGTVTDHTISLGSTFEGEILTTAQNVTLAYSVTTAPKKGTVNIDSASGKYTYTAGAGYAGSDSFVVTVDYGYGSYTKTINVYLDTEPDVSAITTHVTTNQGVSYTGSVQATDIDAGTTLAYSVSEEPTKGSVTLNEHTGSYTYIPLASAAGDDRFTSDITDGTNTVHVVVYIHIETAISTSTTISKVTSQNTSVSGTINATDADGDTLSYSLSSSASHGVASVEAATGKYVYIPNTNYYGSDSFRDKSGRWNEPCSRDRQCQGQPKANN